MTTSKVSVTEGTGKNAATYSFAEDAATKEVQRVALNESDGSDTAIGAKVGSLTETAPASDTASSGLNGRLQRIAQRLTSLIAQIPASLGVKARASSLSIALSTEDVALLPASLGSKAAASSFAVTQSTEDAAQLGSLTETAPASDTASSGLNGRLQRVAQRLTSLIALVPASLGGKVAASSFAVTTASDDPPLALLGAVTETAPASDTASSGLNGRLQRIAQRLTSMIALLPAALTSDGRLKVSTEGGKITYSGGGSVTLAASATDVITLFGSASKTVRVTRIAISGAAAAQSSFLSFLQRRSTADTSGTFVAQTAVTHDSGNAASTATGFGHYTANPTVGTNVGSLRAWLQPFAIAASGQANRIEMDFTTRNSQGLVLRGVAEGVAINLGGQTVTGGVLDYDIEWTEE